MHMVACVWFSPSVLQALYALDKYTCLTCTLYDSFRTSKTYINVTKTVVRKANAHMGWWARYGHILTRNTARLPVHVECRLWNIQTASSSGRLAFSISFEFVSFMHICLLFEWHQISNYFRTRAHFHFRLSSRHRFQIANANSAKECTTMTSIVPKSTRRTKHAHMRDYCNEILSSVHTLTVDNVLRMHSIT